LHAALLQAFSLCCFAAGPQRADAEPLDPRRYNAPTAGDIAAFIPDAANDAPGANRDIVVHLRGGGVQFINQNHPSYDPLHFVLLYSLGQPGFQLYTPLLSPGDDPPDTVRNLSVMQYAAFHLHQRPNASNVLLLARKLLQEWTVDQYCKMEGGRLDWIRFHQSDIRADCYKGLFDAMQDGVTDGSRIGKRVILPGSFINSPRDMNCRFQDATAIVRKHGKPDLFITMTCNPKWPEITAALLPGQTAVDRPDLTCRVFKLKLNELMQDLTKNNIFGASVAHVQVRHALCLGCNGDLQLLKVVGFCLA
jgi:hypothetical protein